MHQRPLANVDLLPTAVRKVKVQSSRSEKRKKNIKADDLVFHRAERIFSLCSSAIEQRRSTNRELWCI